MPLSPLLVLEAGNDTKFQLFSLFNIVRPLEGLTRNLGARQWCRHVRNDCERFASLGTKKIGT